jgi:hypothetical protein
MADADSVRFGSFLIVELILSPMFRGRHLDLGPLDLQISAVQHQRRGGAELVSAPVRPTWTRLLLSSSALVRSPTVAESRKTTEESRRCPTSLSLFRLVQSSLKYKVK